MEQFPEPQIQLAKPGQVDGIFSIMSGVAAHMEHPEYYVIDDRDYVARHISQEGFTLLWMEEVQIAGFLIVHLPRPEEEHNLGNDLGFSPRQLLLSAHMESAAILPEFRGRGIQKKLIAAAESRVTALGYQYSLCTVHPDNLPSLNSLLSLGYEVATTKLKYGGKLRHIMKKELGSFQGGFPMNGLHHIALWAPDEEGFRQALAFYNKVLGCPVVRTWERKGQSAAMLELGGSLLELVIDPAGENGPFAHIAFDVEDVDAVVEQVRAAGRPITMEPTDVSLGPDYPARVAFCKGPVGESVEFFQVL